MKVKLQCKYLKYCFTRINNNIKLDPQQINQILTKPSQINSQVIQKESQQEHVQEVVQKKQKPEMIFDLNKTVLDDMLELYNETKDINEVNKKYGVQLKGFKFGLPIPNIDPIIKGMTQLKEEIDETPPTPLQNLYTKLELNEDSSWNDYCNSIQNTYNFEEILSDKNDKNKTELIKFIQDDIIPYHNLTNEKYMDGIRKYRSLNLNLPGCIETEDPNRFIDNLRPIEDFKHTPQVPISKTRIRQFQELQKKRNEQKFEIVYSIDKFFSLVLFLGSGFLLFYLLRTLQKADERRTEEYFRNKYQKI